MNTEFKSSIGNFFMVMTKVFSEAHSTSFVTLTL